MSKARIKKEMEDTFSQMDELTQIMNQKLRKAKRSPEPGAVIGETDELMRQWSAVAKKYVAISKEYHNLHYKEIPI